MSTSIDSADPVAAVTEQKYKYGFVTDIETETAPKGLNEDIVRFISAKKDEPEWLLEWRLKAYRHWLKMEDPSWAKVDYPAIDFQDAYYYSAPKAAGDGPKSLDEVDPELLRRFQARHALGPPGEEPYRFELSGNGIEDRSQALYYRYEDEFRLYPTNTELLKEIAVQTGGKYLPDAGDIFGDYGETASVPTPLWPWLSLLALFSFFMDIAVRRAPWFWRRFSPARPASV